jgi:hypothetical protein
MFIEVSESMVFAVSSLSYTPKKLVSQCLGDPYALDHEIPYCLYGVELIMIKRLDHCLQIHQQIHLLVQPVHSGKTLSRK